MGSIAIGQAILFKHGAALRGQAESHKTTVERKMNKRRSMPRGRGVGVPLTLSLPRPPARHLIILVQVSLWDLTLWGSH